MLKRFGYKALFLLLRYVAFRGDAYPACRQADPPGERV